MNVLKKLKSKFVFFLILILLALSFRIYNLNNSIWLDEGHSIAIAQQDIYSVVNYLKDVHPPLYYMILHYWMQLFGNSEFSIRFPSVIFGLVSVFVIYKISSELFNKEVGLISSILLSFSLFHIIYSQEARQYALMMLLILISNFFYLKLLNRIKYKTTIGYIISTVLLTYTHMIGLFFIIPQFIYYIFKFRQCKNNIKYWFIIQFIIFILFLPWICMLSKISNTESLIQWLPIPTINDLFNTFISFSNESLIIFLIFIILVFISIFRIKNQMFVYIDYTHKKENFYLLLWVLLPITLVFIISLFVQPLYQSRYLIGALPALYILISNGIYKLKKIGMVILIIIILISISQMFNYYSTNQKEEWNELVNYIDKNEENDSMIILYPNFISDPFIYYYNKTEKSSNIKLIRTGENINKLSQNNDKKYIWLVYYNFLWSSQMKSDSKQIINELNKTYIIQYKDESYKGITLYKFFNKKYSIS